MAYNTKGDNWTHYTGDPCYVIDDSRWSEFCDQIPKEGGYIDWVGFDGETYSVQVWSSPGGDGTWGFSDWGEMPVDAGLLAVVPRECCVIDREDKRFNKGYRLAPMPTDYAVQMGILWVGEPDLETQAYGYWSGAPVTLEGRACDGYTSCDHCGDISAEDQMDYCNHCGYLSCYGCGCDCLECEGCGQMYDSKYEDPCCVKCEECGEVVREYCIENGVCDECEEEEDD